MIDDNLSIALIAITRIERALETARISASDETITHIDRALEFAREAIEMFAIPKEAYE